MTVIPQSTTQFTITGTDAKPDGSFSRIEKQTGAVVQPKDLGNNEVLVKLKAASLNYRDLIIPLGFYPFPCRTPVVAGSDGAGEVIAVGKGVKRFAVGDRVGTLFNQEHQFGAMDKVASESGLGGMVDGTLREYAAFPESGVVHLPSNLDYNEGSTLTCAGLTAWNALYGLKPLRAGDWVLTEGTGGVSIFALQFAKAANAKVVATTSSTAKAKILKDLGADHVINYKEVPNWGVEARKLTPNNIGFQHIIEVGGPNTLQQAYEAIAFEGIISMIGLVGGLDAREKQPNLLEPLSRICTVRGVYVGSRQQMEEMVRFIEETGLQPVVDKTVFKFDDAKEAYKYQWEQKHFGKVVIRIQE